MSAYSTFGALLRRLRKQAGMTQGELAVAVGCSVSYISALETDQRRPDLRWVAARFVPALAATSARPMLDRLLSLADAAAGQTGSATTPDAALGAPAVHGSPPHGALPPLTVELLGRDAEIDALCRRLATHAGRLLTLTGPPGIGKTSLALAVAHAAAPFYADGARLVWLGAVESADLVAPAIATALGLVESNEPPAARLVAHLRRREMLLVLDNFEQVMAAAPLLAELLAASPALRILVTSRERLRLRAEQSIPIRQLDNQAAVALFIARVRTQDQAFAPSPPARATIGEICRLLDELPLAIELIAAHAATLPLPDLLARLREGRLALLTQPSAGLPSAQYTLFTALDRSYMLLTAAEQRLLRALGVFAGGASLAAIASLGFELHTVQALANKSLVRLESQGDDRRAGMLETVRDYALLCLAAAGEVEAAQRGRLAWCIDLAEQAEPWLHSAAQTGWLQRLEADRYNFYAALHDALAAGAIADAARLCAALRHFWVARHHVAEIARWLDAILAAAPDAGLDAHLWVRLLNCAGTIAFYRADYVAANAHYAAALARAEAIGDRRGIAYALDGLGAEAANRGDLALARACSSASLEHSSASGDPWLAGITRMNLGEIARTEGDLVAAAQYYRASLDSLQLAGDPYFIAVAQINLGQVYLHGGELARAESVLRQSLAAGLQAEHVQVVALGLEKLADLLLVRDEERAGQLFGLAQGLRQASGVNVQAVDLVDYTQLAARLGPALQTPGYVDAVAQGARLEWTALRAALADLA